MTGRTPLILLALLQTVLALQVTNSSNLLLGESHRPPESYSIIPCIRCRVRPC